MGTIAHTRGSSLFSALRPFDPLMMLHRSSCSIIKETLLKSVSLVVEGKVTFTPYIHPFLVINPFS